MFLIEVYEEKQSVKENYVNSVTKEHYRMSEHFVLWLDLPLNNQS